VSLPALKDSALGILGTQTGHPILIMQSTRNLLPITKLNLAATHHSMRPRPMTRFWPLTMQLPNLAARTPLKCGPCWLQGNIPTTRGNLKMNTNHFPIQNVYLREVVKDADGVVTTKVTGTVFKDHATPMR